MSEWAPYIALWCFVGACSAAWVESEMKRNRDRVAIRAVSFLGITATGPLFLVCLGYVMAREYFDWNWSVPFWNKNGPGYE